MDPQPLVAVADVEASSRWYRALLGCLSGHGGPDYERLLLDGRIVLQLHRWDAHGHPHLGSPESKPRGNGVLLWFQTDALDAAVARANERPYPRSRSSPPPSRFCFPRTRRRPPAARATGWTTGTPNA